MWSNLIFLQLILVFTCKTYGALAPFINKCHWEDSKCIKASAQAVISMFVDGIPNLGVEKIDPIKIKNLDASSSNLNLFLKDLVGTGLKNCDIIKIQRNKPRSTLAVQVLCSVDFRGQYEMNGRILLLPIQGKGDVHVVLRKIQISVDVDLGDKIDKDGVRHWTIKNWNHNFQLKDKSTLELQNLFNGNEIFAYAVRELIASNSNEIVLEVGPPIVKSVVGKIIDSVENFISNVPADELEL